jgi:hypothetical protein
MKKSTKTNASATVVNAKMLSDLNAIGITETLKTKNEGKSIFKKEFSDKTNRTKCRTKFLNAVQLYLLHVAHNNDVKAKEELSRIKEIAKIYYIAENKFADVADYSSANMDENKRSAIKMFIELQNVVAPKKECTKKIVVSVDAEKEIEIKK